MTYAQAKNQRIATANAVDYAYRDIGQGDVPVLLLQRFRGNLDDWDPALIDALSSRRRIVTFDNTGVGGSSGSTPRTVAEMADDAVSFCEAMGLEPRPATSARILHAAGSCRDAWLGP